MIASSREGAAERLRRDRQRWLERLEDAGRRTRRRGDPESVHDVRVATRQLEACLDVWRSLLPRRRRRRARRALGGLRRDIGPVREVKTSLDVLRQRFTALPSDARVAAALIQDLLLRRLEPLEARAARRCGRGEMAQVRRRVERVWADVAIEPATAFLGAGSARLAERRRRGHAAVGEAARDASDEGLHRARVAAKRWRYALERIAATDPSTDVSEQIWLKAVQEALGKVQDLAGLRRRAMRLGPRLAPLGCGVSSEPMRSLLRSLEEERAEHVRKFLQLAAAAGSGAGRPFAAPGAKPDRRRA